jgi:quinolinate synthase
MTSGPSDWPISTHRRVGADNRPGASRIWPRYLCPHMKRITLPKIRGALETMTHNVTVDPEVAERARRAVERMMALG